MLFLDTKELDKNPYLLGENQQAAINEAREEVANGNYITNADANAEIREWLKQ